MKKVNVVAAIIKQDNKIFVIQRGYGDFKGFWEFPGGKIEAEETPEEALIREIKEELNVGIIVGDHIGTVEYDYPDFHLSMQCFMAEIKTGEMVLNEHSAAKWLTKETLESVEWLPADVVVLERVKEQI